MDLVRAQEALTVARQLDDPTLVAQCLRACGMAAIYDHAMAEEYFAEAIELARINDDRWSLCQIFSYQATAFVLAGEPTAAVAAGEAGRDLADALGDRFFSRNNRAWLACALAYRGDFARAIEVARAMAGEAEAAADLTMALFALMVCCVTLAYQGDAAAAQAAAQSALAASEGMGGNSQDSVSAGFAYGCSCRW